MARLQVSRTIEEIYRPSPPVDKFNGGKINLQGWIRYVYFTTFLIGPLCKYDIKNISAKEEKDFISFFAIWNPDGFCWIKKIVDRLENPLIRYYNE